MPVGNENVKQPIVVVVEKARAPTQKRYRQCRDSSTKTDVGERRVTFIAVKRVVIVGKIRDVEIDFAIAVVITHCDSHGGLLTSIVVQCKSRKIADILKRAIVFVAVQVLGDGIVGNSQVEPTVIVHVNEYRRKSIVALRVRNSSLYAHVGEGSVSVVVKQVIAFARQSAWPAHYFNSAKITEAWRKSARPGDRRMLRIKLCVARNEQIEEAVVIVVSPRRSGRPAPERDARFLRDISECAVMIVVVETVFAEVRYINVWPPVVVVVPHSYAEAPSFICHACFFCDIGECSVMVVVQQHRAWRGFLAFQRGESRAIQQVNVQPAVIVIIKQRHTGTRRLQNRLFFGSS